MAFKRRTRSAGLRGIDRARSMRLFDFRSCGACCDLGPLVDRGCNVRTYLNVSEDEAHPGPVREDPDDTLAIRSYGKLFVVLDHGRCPSFEGKAGTPSAGCGIYADRPRVCRDFEEGEDLCLRFRREHGLPIPAGEVFRPDPLPRKRAVPVPDQEIARGSVDDDEKTEG